MTERKPRITGIQTKLRGAADTPLSTSQDGGRTRTSHYGTRDFKSRASANFATWPWQAMTA